MPFNIKKYLTVSNGLIWVLIALMILNGFYLFVFMMRKYTELKPLDLVPGVQFASFKPYIGDTPKIGYITDKKTSREQIDEAYLQAQYFLAPTVIELKNPRHQFVIIDSMNRNFIVTMMKALKARRLTNNVFGQGLMERLRP